MAKEKLEVDVSPTIPRDSLSKFVQQIDIGFKQGQKNYNTSTLGKMAGDALSSGFRQAAKLPVFDKVLKTANVSGAGRGLGKIGAAASQVGGALSSATMGIAGIYGGAIAGGMAAVGTRSPATLDRFERAIQDVSAVIGEAFIPVMDMATEYLQMVGDVLANILPNASEMREMLQPIAHMFKDLFNAVKPLLPMFRKQLAANIRFLADVISRVVDAMVKVIQKIESWLPDSMVPQRLVNKELEKFDKAQKENSGTGNDTYVRGDQWYKMNAEGRKQLEEALKREFGVTDRSSRDMHHRNISYQGLKQAGEEMRLKAFQGPGTQEKIEDNTKRIADAAEKIVANTAAKPAPVMGGSSGAGGDF